MDIMFKGGMSGIEATRQDQGGLALHQGRDHDRPRRGPAAGRGGRSRRLRASWARTRRPRSCSSAAKSAADGEVLIDPATLTRLLAQVAREREAQRDAQNLLDDLTEREREILQLLAEGMRNDDIAAKLFISPQTVQTHVRNILGKLRVHSKLEAVAFAVKHGAITV